jgi:Acylphosphatase
MRTRLRIRVEGIVQGVGFRPCVYALATRFSLVLPLYFWTCMPFIGPIWGEALMPAAPPRPGPHPCHWLRRGQPQTSEEPPTRAATPWPTRPRVAWQAAKRLGVGDSHVFWGASGGRGAAGRTVHRAYAHLGQVLGRYHPVHLRTAS